MKIYKYNSKQKTKQKICNECYAIILERGFLGCPYRDFDNEFCGNIAECRKALKEQKEKNIQNIGGANETNN